MKFPYKLIRVNDETPMLPPKIEAAMLAGGLDVIRAYTADQIPAVPFEVRKAIVKSLVVAANTLNYSSEDAAALYRAAEIFAGRGSNG